MMNSHWQAFLATHGAQIENMQVTGFGQCAAERQAARAHTIIAPLSHLALLECSGDDARSFLHNQLTSDVNHLAETAAQHAAWCSAKGRMLASFVLYRQATAYRALLSADLLAETQKRLQIYILRSKVRLQALTDEVLIGIAGPQAATALADAGLTPPDKPMEIAECAGGTLLRLDAQRFILVAAPEAAQACWEALSHSPVKPTPVGTPVWQWLEIQAGIPRISAATREEFVPQMANFEQIGGVSFRKGCYPGQEVVARTQHLGRIKRHLYRLHADGPAAAGQRLMLADSEQVAGQIVNAAPAPEGGYDALAVIKEDFVDQGTTRLTLPGVTITTVIPL